MSDIVISVENLSKKYRIHHQQRECYTALRDVIAHKFAAPFQALLGRNGSRSAVGSAAFFGVPAKALTSDLRPLTSASAPPAQEDFWALKDVSFEVKRGEVLGIIGRNGAGKSTLLKVLSRITEPTEGRVRIKGRVASLLEVGTGFHPELTGRENVFLNGAILGMSRVEIKQKFDEIVAFAGVEQFLDTPVKRYSSGMYVRLAFAVAAHLEPQILVVDEVLAVGDAEFQKKCLGKMQDVASGGRTVLFVSHNMAAVQNLCTRGIVLDSGVLCHDGEKNEAVKHYLSMASKTPGAFKGDAILRNLSVRNDDGVPSLSFVPGQSITILARLCPPRPLAQASFGYGILNVYGDRVTTLHTCYQRTGQLELGLDSTVSVRWNNCKLCPGSYKVMAALYDGQDKIAVWDHVFSLTIDGSDYYQTGRMPETGPQGWHLSDADWNVGQGSVDEEVTPSLLEPEVRFKHA